MELLNFVVYTFVHINNYKFVCENLWYRYDTKFGAAFGQVSTVSSTIKKLQSILEFCIVAGCLYNADQIRLDFIYVASCDLLLYSENFLNVLGSVTNLKVLEIRCLTRFELEVPYAMVPGLYSNETLFLQNVHFTRELTFFFLIKGKRNEQSKRLADAEGQIWY